LFFLSWKESPRNTVSATFTYRFTSIFEFLELGQNVAVFKLMLLHGLPANLYNGSRITIRARFFKHDLTHETISIVLTLDVKGAMQQILTDLFFLYLCSLVPDSKDLSS